MNLQENIHRIKDVMGILNESDQVFPKGKYAYHITPDIFLDKIKEYGLVPKSESKLSYHPERIYLFMNPNMDKEMTNVLWNATKKETRDKIKDYYVLQIDLNQIPNHIFYNDPASSFSYVAIFTVQSIQNTAIKVIKKIPISELKIKEVISPKDEKRMEDNYNQIISNLKSVHNNDSFDHDQISDELDKLGDMSSEEQEKMDREYETLMANLKN